MGLPSLHSFRAVSGISWYREGGWAALPRRPARRGCGFSAVNLCAVHCAHGRVPVSEMHLGRAPRRRTALPSSVV